MGKSGKRVGDKRGNYSSLDAVDSVPADSGRCDFCDHALTMFLFTMRAIIAVFRFPIPTTKPELTDLKGAER